MPQFERSISLVPVEIYLPFPPSTNALYKNVAGKGRAKTKRYLCWERSAGWDLLKQKPKKIKGPVEIVIYLQEPDEDETKDCSNHAKAVEDFLVTHKIIEADDSTIVRSCKQVWSLETRGCRVSIRPAPVHSEVE